MDWMTYLIGIGLVWTGAAFFGYPVGRMLERRQINRETGLSISRRPRRFFRNADVLDAEILEEVKR